MPKIDVKKIESEDVAELRDETLDLPAGNEYAVCGCRRRPETRGLAAIK